MNSYPTPASNYYDDVDLDRADALRGDSDRIDGFLESDQTRFLPVVKNQSFVSEDTEPRASFLGVQEVQALQLEGQRWIFLGVREERAYFALDADGADTSALKDRGNFKDLRTVGPHMPRTEAALLAYARAMVYWAQRHAYCGTCGSATEADLAGHIRACTNGDCGILHFPRTDPAIICLVHDGAGQCLLGRQASWPAGMQSTLAGFVEPGESLESAVAREVHEEVGLRIDHITYQHSQPWPFPSSLMVGFHAQAQSRELQVNPSELQSADWFTREYVRAQHRADVFHLPHEDSIARRLIEEWLAETI